MSDFRKRETRKLVDPQKVHFIDSAPGLAGSRKRAKANGS